MKTRKNLIREPVEEIEVFDDVQNTLAELLEEKVALTHEEWEARIKELVAKRASSPAIGRLNRNEPFQRR